MYGSALLLLATAIVVVGEPGSRLSGTAPTESRCSCARLPDAREALAMVGHVFLGEVIMSRDTTFRDSTDTTRVRGTVMTIVVRERWKGTPADTVRLFAAVLCDYTFKVGQRALVFASGSIGALDSSVCLPTALEEQATAHLQLLGPPLPRGRGPGAP